MTTKSLPPPCPLSVHPDNVWSFEQNRPTLVASDLEVFGVPRRVSYAILCARGVFKWLAVRRDLIKLKDHYRGEVTRLLTAIENARAGGNAPLQAELRGRLSAYAEALRDIRSLCHSDRWRAPDFDGDAWAWLKSIAPFRADSRWLETARRSRHARVGSEALRDEELAARVARELGR